MYNCTHIHIHICMYNCVKPLGWEQQARRPAAFAKNHPDEFPALPETVSPTSQGASFLQDSASR